MGGGERIPQLKTQNLALKTLLSLFPSPLLFRHFIGTIADKVRSRYIETESTLVDQPKKTELEYRVIAINLVPENPLSWFCSRGKSGEGLPSNTVMAVL